MTTTSWQPTEAPASSAPVAIGSPVAGVGWRAQRRSVLAGVPGFLFADLIATGLALVSAQVMAALVARSSVGPRVLDLLGYVPLLIATMAIYGLYRKTRRRLVNTSFPDLGLLFHSLVVGCVGLLVLSGPAHSVLGLPPLGAGRVALTGALAFIAIPALRAAARQMTVVPDPRAKRVVVVGSGVVAASLIRRLHNVSDLQVVGYIDDNTEGQPPVPPAIRLLGSLDQLPGVVAEHNVGHVVVAFSPATGARLAGLLRSLAGDVRISVVPRLFDLLTIRSHVEEIYGLPVINVAPASLSTVDRVAKRGLDVVASLVALALLSPIMIAVAIAIKATSEGPVFFRQDRTGQRGTNFRIFKFRSMYTGSHALRASLCGDNEGPVFKKKEDPRVTPVGRFIRKTSLDEMPQLLNVLGGSMSLVGPRPFTPEESADIRGWAAKRFDVKPGMTGLWQVSGRSDLPFEELCRLDYCYVTSWSLWWDLRILWHTPGTVVRHLGAY